jgi:hypothetical protein
MVRHRIVRAIPHPDRTVAIEWADKSRSVVDMRPQIERGGLLKELGEEAIFLRRLYVHAEGESLGWEVYGHLVDFDADDLWRDSRSRAAAAE